MEIDKLLLEMGLEPRFIRILREEEKNFFISIRDIFDDLYEQVKLDYTRATISTLLIGLRKLSYYDDEIECIFNEFEKYLLKLIKSLKRQKRLNLVLVESVMKFSDFRNFNKFF